MAQDMVNAALAQQNKKVADFSGMPKDNWCAYFICWCANASGASAAGILPTKYSDCSTTGKVAYWAAKHKGMVYVFTADGKSKMQQNAPSGNWSYVSQSSVTPKVGDIALFHWKGASGTWNHVGIVYKVDSSKIYYVDGNGTSGGYNNSYVTTHTLSRTSSEIAGYIRPAYSGSGGTVSSSITLKSASYTNLKENSVQVKGYVPVQRNPAFRGRALFRNVARQYEKGGFRPDQSHEKSVRHLVRPQRTDAGDDILLAPVCPGKRKDRLELRRGSVVPYSGYGSW